MRSDVEMCDAAGGDAGAKDVGAAKDLSNFPSAVDFGAWVEAARPSLQPPVGNKLLYGGQHKVMIVGGPNQREDYHLEIGEEIFLQLEGDMCLKIMERGVPKDVVIKEGEIFMLPGRIPHSPQRKAATIGLVLERERSTEEIDGLRWYTRDGSNRILYQEFFHCTDLGVQLKPVIERFFASDCYKSGAPDKSWESEPAPTEVDTTTVVHAPFALSEWIARVAKPSPSGSTVLFGEGAVDPALRPFEYKVEVITAPQPSWEADWRSAAPGELFLYQLEGSATVEMRRSADGAVSTTSLGPKGVLLVPGSFAVKVRWEPGCVCMAVTNRVVAPSVASP